MSKKRVLIFLVSYEAENFIQSVLERIPDTIWDNDSFDTEILIIDDQTGDPTFLRAKEFALLTGRPNITVLPSPHHQGYGGNQKIGYHYAIQKGFDAVVLLHGNGQYPPEYLEQMIIPILNGKADAVFGSRMMDKKAAFKGPIYKWMGNHVLTLIQNKILNAHLSEFHTGYRSYSVQALTSIPFELNSNDFDFDTDIIIQMLDTGKRILEIPIPTYYGKEISQVNGFRYGALVIKTTIVSRIMRWGIFYDPRFDYETTHTYYTLKLGYDSSHQFALDRILPGSSVLDIGCGSGQMAFELSKKNVYTVSVDQYITPTAEQYSAQTVRADIEDYDFGSNLELVDFILLLDVIEHLRSPENLLKNLRRSYSKWSPHVVLTTGNIAFLPIRLALIVGQFNYGKRGILDLSHTRLFTFYSLRKILINCGFEILEEKGIPAPFPLAFGENHLSRILLEANRLLIRISKSLFSYQIAMIARPKPTLESLLEKAKGFRIASKEKVAE